MLTLLSEPFPGRGSLRYGGKPADLPEMEDTNIVPVLWVSALLSEKFWETEVAKYGSRALNMPQYVKTTRRFKNGTTFNSPETLDVDTPLDTLRDRLRTTTLDFNNRHLKWIQLRPWYQEEGFKWFISPWGVDAWRSALSNFKVAHARQDERKCFREINNVMDLYQSGNKWTWLYHALGLLMSASVPLRRVNSPPDENLLKEINDSLYRSEAAKKNPSKHQRIEEPKLRPHPTDRRRRFIFNMPRTIYKNPLDRKAEATPVNRHTDWLNAFMSFCKVHARLDPLPRGWHQSLFETHTQLLQSRQSNPACGRFEDWAPFDFKVPPYDPQWQTWDRASDGRGGMRQMLVDKDPPVLFENTPEGNRTNFDRETQLRDRLDVDALRWFGPADPQGNPVPYFTLTEVGSHREAGDAWVVMPNKNSLPNVWDVTGEL